MNRSSSHDFDFLDGTWRVRHRRLRERLVGCEDWQVFDGRCSMRRLMGGRANIEEHRIAVPGDPYEALALRTFDGGRGTWSIWWLDGRDPHRLDVPVVGAFEDGVGVFHADDWLHGRPIRVRFRWTATSSGRPHWEQAFSGDGGATWEINWTMQFERESVQERGEP